MATGLFNLKQVNQAISQGAWSGYIAPKWVEYLVVAGGGSGGGNGGGGGAGGLLTGIVTVAAGTSYTVTVGAGGTGGVYPTQANGNNSVFGSITAIAGGKGGGDSSSYPAGSGGSGGGSGYYASIGQGTSGQGNAGGAQNGLNSGGGGGGAGTVGLNGATTTIGGNGGAGIASAITGTVVTYAGGGAGWANTPGTGGVGGVGGGGSAGAYQGVAGSGGGNTGGGGAGSAGGSGTSGSGGSGIVVVRYPGSIQFFTGGTLSYANGYMIHTFYASGTLAPTTPTPYVTDYQISRSLRFNSADSAYLNRTPASATNRKTWTLSFWVKRAALGSQEYILFAGSDSNNRTGIRWNNDNLEFEGQSGGATQIQLTTSAVYRDVSAWYHIVYMLDTTQATSSERAKIYVNGSQVTAFGTATYPSQNADLFVNSTNAHAFGRYSPAPSNYLNNYLTEVNFIDGQALTPSSFGYTNPATGVWSPLAFVGTYGTNGFELNFSDNSNTTAATLGKDYSGNGNNWTPNNFSVTAGAGNDSLVDSPTSYGTDTGVGGTVRGNYCTWNPLSNPSGTLSNGNLQIKGGTTRGVWTTFGLTSGKWYWEFNITSASVSNGPYFGISNYASTGQFGTVYALLRSADASYINNGCSVTGVGSGDITSGTVGVAIDVDAGTATLYHNNATRLTVSGISAGTYYAYFCADATTDQFDLNAGQRPFAYTAPSGYKALCTQNLPTPAIGATSTTLATSFFAPVIYTGTGATQTVTVGFETGLLWGKERSGADRHWLADQVRGLKTTGYYLLSSNNTNADTSSAAPDGVTAITSTGFTLGANTSNTDGNWSYEINQSGSTYVAWNWKANGSGSTNTAGSITSTVSANTTSGFSVVTYTGNGTQPSTVGHGLGVAPSFVIVKTRNSASYDWNCYHISLGNTQYIALNTTAAASSAVSLWNNTTPTSTVFTVNHVAVNTSSNTYVAYCFAPVAGFSAFGTYTGNGSSDGVFVFTGMRPAYVLIKRTTSAYNWWILDAARGTINAVKGRLYADASDAESTTYPYLDFLSNGFKLRDADGGLNASGAPYIYACFAQNPFKYSLAR